MENMTAQHPFFDRTSLVMVGDHVTLDAGTGLVHTAPGHGEDDYIIGKKYGLDILSPVDARGSSRKKHHQALKALLRQSQPNDY